MLQGCFGMPWDAGKLLQLLGMFGDSLGDLSGRFFFSTGPLESRSRSPTLCGDPDIEPLSEILGVLRTGDFQNANGFNTKSWSTMDDLGHPLDLGKL